MQQVDVVEVVEESGVAEPEPVEVTTPIERAFAQYIAKMPATQQRHYRQAVRKCFEKHPVLLVGSACSGSEVQSKVWKAFQQHIADIVGIDVEIKHKFACENQENKLRFIEQEAKPAAHGRPSAAFPFGWASSPGYLLS